MTGGWLSTTEAAHLLDVTVAEVYRLINAGELAGYRIGHNIKVKQADVDAHLSEASTGDGVASLSPDATMPPARRLGASKATSDSDGISRVR